MPLQNFLSQTAQALEVFLISQYAFAGNLTGTSTIFWMYAGGWRVQVSMVMVSDHRYRHGFYFGSFGWYPGTWNQI